MTSKLQHLPLTLCHRGGIGSASRQHSIHCQRLLHHKHCYSDVSYRMVFHWFFGGSLVRNKLPRWEVDPHGQCHATLHNIKDEHSSSGIIASAAASEASIMDAHVPQLLSTRPYLTSSPTYPLPHPPHSPHRQGWMRLSSRVIDWLTDWVELNIPWSTSGNMNEWRNEWMN